MKRALLAALAACSFGTSSPADTLDQQLNAAYHEAMTSKRFDPETLQWIERNWIAYRDAAAELQAWIVGKTVPDESARAASIAQTTKIRLAELLRIAKTGTAVDSTVVAPPSGAAVHAYAELRKAVVDRGNPGLTTALLLDQKAWLEFSGNESDYNAQSVGMLEKERLAQLQDAAARLGIVLSPPAADPEAEEGQDRWIAVSADHLLRVEQADGPTAWVISNKTGERAKLPMDRDEANTGREKPTVDISEFEIAPDGQWIFRTQKFYHRMCGAYLYRRTSPDKLDFVAATPKPLDILAWEFCVRETHAAVDPGGGGVIRFVAWKPGRVRISLNSDTERGEVGANDWQIDYDFKTGTFSVPPGLKSYDGDAIGPE